MEEWEGWLSKAIGPDEGEVIESDARRPTLDRRKDTQRMLETTSISSSFEILGDGKSDNEESIPLYCKPGETKDQLISRLRKGLIEVFDMNKAWQKYEDEQKVEMETRGRKIKELEDSIKRFWQEYDLKDQSFTSLEKQYKNLEQELQRTKRETRLENDQAEDFNAAVACTRKEFNDVVRQNNQLYMEKRELENLLANSERGKKSLERCIKDMTLAQTMREACIEEELQRARGKGCTLREMEELKNDVAAYKIALDSFKKSLSFKRKELVAWKDKYQKVKDDFLKSRSQLEQTQNLLAKYATILERIVATDVPRIPQHLKTRGEFDLFESLDFSGTIECDGVSLSKGETEFDSFDFQSDSISLPTDEKVGEDKEQVCDDKESGGVRPTEKNPSDTERAMTLCVRQSKETAEAESRSSSPRQASFHLSSSSDSDDEVFLVRKGVSKEQTQTSDSYYQPELYSDMKFVIPEDRQDGEKNKRELNVDVSDEVNDSSGEEGEENVLNLLYI